jgi:hypothetical protein
VIVSHGCRLMRPTLGRTSEPTSARSASSVLNAEGQRAKTCDVVGSQRLGAPLRLFAATCRWPTSAAMKWRSTGLSGGRTR